MNEEGNISFTSQLTVKAKLKLLMRYYFYNIIIKKSLPTF